MDGPIGEASDGIAGVPCEDLPHRPDSGGGGGPASDQYNNGGDVNNPDKVIPDTTSKKPLPDTGGPSYLAAVGAMLLLGAAVVAGRGVLRR